MALRTIKFNNQRTTNAGQLAVLGAEGSMFSVLVSVGPIIIGLESFFSFN